MSLRLGFDVDGVLADFRAAFRAVATRITHGDPHDFDDMSSPQSDVPLSQDEVRRVWDHIAKTPNWWMEIEAYEPEQIARLYGLARAAGWEVFFLTKRPPSAGDSVQFQTQWWIERFGFYLPSVLTVPGSRGEIANALRLDLILDDQLINCVEVVSASTTKAILMQRTVDAVARDHATSRGIGVVSNLADALGVMERLQDVLAHKRGRLLRLTDWFSRAPGMQTLPQNPRAIRPVPPVDRSHR
ncbi:MAG TPA: hypothetical protein VEL51_11175 [Vicinamibacterales bacterium]|nr:hypothetical protein [Vicinamibacterales bacterium]